MKVIEGTNIFNFYINKNLFINSLDKALIFSNDETSTVTLTLNANEMTVFSQDIDKGALNEKLVIKGNIKEEIKVVLNVNKLLILLKNIANEEVLFELSSNITPILLKNPKNSDYVSLILPARR
jgi:DNA polymerase-3 subunit beta